MNDHIYPTEDYLEKIRQWVVPDVEIFRQFMEDIKHHWQYADSGYWEQDGDKYTLHTAGWSGNEDLISAMRDNEMFWMLYWESHRRGGHYVFCPVSVETKSSGSIE